MDENLRTALAPVLHDLQDAQVMPPRIDDDRAEGRDSSSAVLWSADGGGTGVHVSRSGTRVERIVAATDQVQEWAIEELWATRSTSWPGCPRHPNTHPLRPVTRDERAWWVCPGDDVPIVEIGAL